jgi:transposase
MIIDRENIRIYIKPGYVDFRKQINGLTAIAAQQMKKDLFSGAFFLFTCKNRMRMKILYWDKTGFCIWAKRLEKEKFT